MEITPLIIGIVIGVALGALAVAWRARGRQATQEAERARLEAGLEAEKRAAEKRLQDFRRAEEQLKDTFKALSADALKASSSSFLDLAKETLAGQQAEAKGELEKREQAVKHLVDPLSKSLEAMRKQMEDIETTRAESFGSLTTQLKSLTADQDKLRSETVNLVQALRKPSVRGQWGEIQLERVVEMAGMIEHCDFRVQASVDTEKGALRPDLVVNLPGGKTVIVDAKTPLDAFLNSLEAQDETSRQDFLSRHAQQVRTHILSLSRKSYWDQFETSPEFVVMFLPSESFFYAALEQDPALIETGVSQKVILATPTTLIALLRAVHYGWQQEALAANAKLISDLGRDLYDRIRVLAKHIESLGRNLDRSVGSYNEAVGSLEHRVLPGARRFTELGLSAGEEIPRLSAMDKTVRPLQSQEWLRGDEPEGEDSGES